MIFNNMATHYDEIKGLLEKMPRARERSNKNRFLATLLHRKYESRLQTDSSVNIVENIIVAAASYDRVWRQVLQHEPNLRGSDYDKKQELEELKQLDLGYVPGHEADIKKLKNLK